MSKNTNIQINENDGLGVNASGFLEVFDTTGSQAQQLVAKKNAIHPQNVARVIGRALARESNNWIHRIAFGNGGTITDAAFQVTFRTPNDGQIPDTAGWTSRLYNEVYSEIVDDSNPNVTLGAGSAPGDPVSVEHVSGPGVRSSESGLNTHVVIEAVLNPNEPQGQPITDNLTGTQSTESDFLFDEIGLFTTGLPPVATAGYHDVDVSNKTINDPTGLALGTQYQFEISIDGAPVTLIEFTTATTGSGPQGEHTYSDLVGEINSQLNGATAEITDLSQNIQTFGALRFISDTSGPSSEISLQVTGGSNDLFNNLQGFVELSPVVAGQGAGVQNNPTDPQTERERLLTHVIFSPILKSSNRQLTIRYTLTISVGRSINPVV